MTWKGVREGDMKGREGIRRKGHDRGGDMEGMET